MNVVIAGGGPGEPQKSLDPSNHFGQSTASRSYLNPRPGFLVIWS